MKINRRNARQGVVGFSAGCVLAGAVAALVAAPTASAAPDCSPSGVANTVSSATGSAQGYLNNHPGANQVVTAAYSQPQPVAASNLRSYFTANPTEYYELRGHSWPQSVTPSVSATSRCFRPGWPRPMTSSWPADR